MRDNKKLINIRVTEKEKQKLEQLAGKCGLSLSEYLRQRGLGYAPGPVLDARFYEAYSVLCDISNLPLNPETETALMAVFDDLNKILLRPQKQTQAEIIREVTAWQQPDSGR